MGSVDEVTDWRTLVPILPGCEEVTPEWICWRRSVLESIVEPFVTTKKTGQVVTFRGKRRYLSVDPRRIENQKPSSSSAQPMYAVLALQFLYRMEAARKTSDLNALVKMAIAFARADVEVNNQYLFGADSSQAMERLDQERRGTSKGGKATKELTSDDQILLLRITYAKYRGQVRALTKIADELHDKHGIKSKRGKRICEKTIRDRLKELGIWENAKRSP